MATLLLPSAAALPRPDAPSASDDATVALSEVLSALSYALDLTEGQLPGHTLRSCAIGMRLGAELGLDGESRTALYFALLLKDAGCSSNAARMAALFGSDDQRVKLRMKTVDWHHALPLAVETARNCGIGLPLAERVRLFLGIARTEHMTRDLMAVRCDRGAQIASGLGFPERTADAIRALDEHWNGNGYPAGLRGEQIPLLARVANLAQVTELFLSTEGVRAAMDAVRRRKGRWFDPRLSDVVLSWRHDRAWWHLLGDERAVADHVVSLEPGTVPIRLDAIGLDAVARAFAEIIDAKSPFTYRHSSNVAAYAEGIAQELGFAGAPLRRVWRAAMLHDIGKLGVSNRILDKPAALDAGELSAMRAHPRHTLDILARVPAFSDFARLAAVHHEKLDGSGYPWGLRGDELDEAARALCVADILEALTADRPYRAGMSFETALGILGREVKEGKLCGRAVGAAEAFVGRGSTSDQ